MKREHLTKYFNMFRVSCHICLLIYEVQAIYRHPAETFSYLTMFRMYVQMYGSDLCKTENTIHSAFHKRLKFGLSKVKIRHVTFTTCLILI